MKNRELCWLFLSILILITGCENHSTEIDSGLKDGFCLIINDSIVYNQQSIEFYDFSSHLIYLKEGCRFTYSDPGYFSILAGNTEIYTGQMMPMYFSYFPLGPCIPCSPNFYNANVFSRYCIPMKEGINYALSSGPS